MTIQERKEKEKKGDKIKDSRRKQENIRSNNKCKSKE